MRTEVIRHRIIVDAGGSPVLVEDASDSAAEGSYAPDREANRAFWQRFIDTVRFDHPDQPPPRHGGNNWVRIPLPPPARWLTAFRYGDELGFFLAWEKDSTLYNDLAREADALRQETGLPDLRFHQMNRPDLEDAIGINRAVASLDGPDGQIAWLADTANRLVAALRPRLAALADA
jgi:hypothetical protein